MSLLTSPTRSRVKRAALVLSAGLFATTLAIGGGLAANAAPAPSVTANVATATVNGGVNLNVVGFGAGEYMTINFDSTSIASGNADVNGAYQYTLSVPSGATIGNHSVTVVGDTAGTFTVPVEVVASPTVSPAATTLTVSAFKTTGVTAVFSGFTPGDTVKFGFGVDGAGGDSFGTPVTVDASGVVSATLRASDTTGFGTGAPGTYFLSAMNDAGNINAQIVTITVVADPATPATPVKARASFTG